MPGGLFNSDNSSQTLKMFHNMQARLAKYKKDVQTLAESIETDFPF